jgi:hypothetical protein
LKPSKLRRLPGLKLKLIKKLKPRLMLRRRLRKKPI